MTSRAKPVSDEWLAMSDEQRMAELRDGLVTDRAQVPAEKRARFDEMLAQARRNVGADRSKLSPS